MAENLKRSSIKSKAVFVLKIIAAIVVMAMAAKAFFKDGCSSYFTARGYSYQNDFSQEQVSGCNATELEQDFSASGNIISNISLYFSGVGTGEISIELLEMNGKQVHSVVVDAGDFMADAWNKFAFDCKVRRGQEYRLRISSDSALNFILIDRGDKPESLTACRLGQEGVDGSLVMGIDQTYRYITAARTLELVFATVMIALMNFVICFAIFNIEKLVSSFKSDGKKQGLLYALYFAITYIFLFNPINPSRTEALSFDRVFGEGLAANVDVDRRVNNFYFWFLCFATVFALAYMLMNHLKEKEISDEQGKVMGFLDNFMILANANVLFRCITYFSDNSTAGTVFYYSTALINLIIILCVLYIYTGLGNRMSSKSFMVVELASYSMGFPLAIISQWSWESGKLLFGVQMVLMVTSLLIATCLARRTGLVKRFIGAAAPISITASLFPFMTSFFIELVNVLNQYGIFIESPRICYVIFMVLCILLSFEVQIILSIKGRRFVRWKTWSFLFLIIGVTSLSCQIPLEGTYGAHLFESANSSILISDFLQFGDVPIVQHYGGHMMSGVWEGIFYGIVNRDFTGAIFSPYAGYVSVTIAALFFLFVRKIWNEEMALFVTLLFPFSSFWGIHGLGMLVCLAVLAYLRKNTWPRAILVWLTLIWCVLYRLDLGFATAAACIVSLLIYLVRRKDWNDLKQLGITLAGCGIAGITGWLVICVVNGVNPISRLLEFIAISLSNQNWSYAEIGNMEAPIFSWCYLIVPFLVVLCMCCVLFSKKFKENVDDGTWVLLLFLGFSYLANFPRGVVRHSLIEAQTGDILHIIVWDAYFFFAVFLAALVRKKMMFLPALTGLILITTALTTTTNFTESTIADSSSARLGNFTSTWTVDSFVAEDAEENPDAAKTYWMKLKELGEPVERVVWDPSLEAIASEYKFLIDSLLDDDETFVDMTNNTFVYSAIERRDPVYVSQSPLQLSGEYAQERFVEEMKGVPILLMPISDPYHFYKIAEYTNQNYVPLCKYSSPYTNLTIWCLKERYGEFKEKSEALKGIQVWDGKNAEAQLEQSNCILKESRSTGGFTLESSGEDPHIGDLQKEFDMSEYYNQNIRISIVYSSNVTGQMVLYYTTDENEEYNENKLVSSNIEGDGTAIFDIPVSQYTKIRLDIPEGSVVKIKSITTSRLIEEISFGYDEPSATTDQNGDVWLTYDNGLHSYSLGYLPRIWADYDISSRNEAYSECTKTDRGTYVFERSSIKSSVDGNYLLVQATYDGNDDETHYEADDEITGVSLKLGTYQDGIFTEKCQFQFNMEEGTHEYIFRVSCDSNWYHEAINAIRVQGEGRIHVESIKILEGD